MEISKKNRRIMLVFGILILILVATSFIGGWFSISKKISDGLSQLSDEEKKKIFNLDLLPTVSGAFFQVRFTFTYISNILLGLSLILFSMMPFYVWIKKLYFFSIVYITITFIVFWFVIVPYIYFYVRESHSIPTIEIVFTFLVHLINPLIGIIFFIINKKNIVITKWNLYISSLFSLLYYLFTLAVYFVGIKVVDNFLSNPGIPDKDSKGWDIYLKLQITIYPMLNFRRPWGYEDNNLLIKILLNLTFPIMSILITISISWFWVGVCKIKIYNKEMKKDSDFLKFNKFLNL